MSSAVYYYFLALVAFIVATPKMDIETFFKPRHTLIPNEDPKLKSAKSAKLEPIANPVEEEAAIVAGEEIGFVGVIDGFA